MASMAAPPETSQLWIVRHGERVDETVNAAAWKAETPRCRHFDPPLTVDGERQARAAAAVLASGARDRAGSAIPKFDRIYASPCARTLATARELSASLGDLPVTVVPALAACAAAVKRRGLRATPFLADAAAVALCPALEGVAHDAPDEFDTACAWLARTSQKPVLVVSHREGIRDLAHERLKLPYCAIAAFEIAPDRDAEAPVDWVLKTLRAPDGAVLLAR